MLSFFLKWLEATGLKSILFGMFKSLVQESIHELHTDVRIIRLTFLTSFFHSLIIILVIILDLNSFIANKYEDGLYVGKVAQFFVEEISKNHFVNIVLVITILLFVLYSIIYPIGQAAIIHYLHDKQGIKNALRKGLKNFFPMFEFGAVSIVTSPIVFLLAAFKVVVVDGNAGAWIIVLLLFWRAVLIVINVLKSYTRYCITLEHLMLGDALKRSFSLCKTNLWHSFKFMRIQTILLINFSFNLIVVLGIPILIMYLAITFDATNILVIKLILYIVFFLLVILGAYMSSFIRAFFAYYWYKLYQNVKK